MRKHAKMLFITATALCIFCTNCKKKNVEPEPPPQNVVVPSVPTTLELLIRLETTKYLYINDTLQDLDSLLTPVEWFQSQSTTIRRVKRLFKDEDKIKVVLNNSINTQNNSTNKCYQEGRCFLLNMDSTTYHYLGTAVEYPCNGPFNPITTSDSLTIQL